MEGEEAEVGSSKGEERTGLQGSKAETLSGGWIGRVSPSGIQGLTAMIRVQKCHAKL